MRAVCSTVRYVLLLGSDLGLSERDLETLRSRTKREGVSFLTLTLPLLGKALERGIADGTFKLPTNFKKKYRNSEIPAFCGSFFEDVFRRDGTLLSNACPVAVYVIRQLCYSVNKNSDIECSEEQKNQAYSRVRETEEDNKKFCDEFKPSPLLALSRQLIAEVFRNFSLSDFHPKHGPGQVTNSTFYRKNESRISPQAVRKDPMLNSTYWFNPEDGFTRLERYPVWRHADYFTLFNTAEAVDVPKDSRGPRIISKESWENQYHQQGIMELMIKCLNESWLTSGRVNFDDQTVNQSLAISGSIDQFWSTIDLKDASDRVVTPVVAYLFKPTPLFDLLMQTRSDRSLLKEDFLPHYKFAPMGSAVCFTTLSALVWSVSVSALMLEGVSLDLAADYVYVYGDDIVVPTKHAEAVINALESVNLKVNKEKSFVGSEFLESCGVDAFRGNDVTPVRLRKCLTSKRKPSTFSSVVSTAQQLQKAGLARSSEYLYSLVQRLIGRLPYGSSRSPYLCRLWTGRSDLIPEANAFEYREWRKRPLELNPLGRGIAAWRVDSVISNRGESSQGRLMRTIGLLGKDIPLPEFGVFSVPRRTALRRGVFDHYDMS